MVPNYRSKNNSMMVVTPTTTDKKGKSNLMGFHSRVNQSSFNQTQGIHSSTHKAMDILRKKKNNLADDNSSNTCSSDSDLPVEDSDSDSIDTVSEKEESKLE